MCNPALIFAGVAAAGALIGGVSTYMQTSAAQDSAEAQAKIFKFQRDDALARGRREEELVRARVAKMKAMQRAAYGASGAVVDYGSALDVLEDSAYYGELDALNTRANFAREAWGYQVQRNYAKSEADSLRQQKYMSIGTTLLGAASAGMNTYSLASGGVAAFRGTGAASSTLTGGTYLSSNGPGA
jgi:hypothetical protein